MAKAGWGDRIKERARELGLTDAAVARALGLTQRRYSNYANESREPPFALLLRICAVLRTDPNTILGHSETRVASTEDGSLARLDAALLAMSLTDRERTLAVVEALAAFPSPNEAPPARRSPAEP